MSDKRAPWMKFYGADWRANAQLRMCSLAARGLWIEMLCLAHEAEPYGHVLIAGRVPSAAQLAIQVGALPREVEKLIAELEAAGVFDRSHAGAVVSRRMVRDREKAERDSANGRGGGNPRLKPKDNEGVNPPDKAQRPEARSQKPEKQEEEAQAPLARARRKPNIALPESWEPNGDHRAKALSLGVDCRAEADRMRNWAASKDERRADWDATFHNWITRASEDGNGKNGQHGRAGAAADGKTQRDIQLAAAVEAARRAGSGYGLWDADPRDPGDPG